MTMIYSTGLNLIRLDFKNRKRIGPNIVAWALPLMRSAIRSVQCQNVPAVVKLEGIIEGNFVSEVGKWFLSERDRVRQIFFLVADARQVFDRTNRRDVEDLFQERKFFPGLRAQWLGAEAVNKKNGITGMHDQFAIKALPENFVRMEEDDRAVGIPAVNHHRFSLFIAQLFGD